MRIIKEVGHGAALQAVRERRAREERADAQQAALFVQGMRPELHRHAPTRQTAGPEGGCRAAVCQWSIDEPHRQAARCLHTYHPGLARAVRGSLRAKARAGRTSGGDRARRDVALLEKSPRPFGSGRLGIVLQGTWWTGNAVVVTRSPVSASSSG